MTPEIEIMQCINKNKVLLILNRVLNLIDPRLMGHSLHVALVLRSMLIAENRMKEQDIKTLELMALLHDIGAYKTEEIGQILAFDTVQADKHSIYGYLLLKNYFPYRDSARIVLYHHRKYVEHWPEDAEILHYAQLLHVADRVCVWHDAVKCTKSKLMKHLEGESGNEFSPEAVRLFWKADQMFDLWKNFDANSDFIEKYLNELSMAHQEMNIQILIDVIDFRSRNTMLHTISVMEIAKQMAKLYGFSDEVQDKIYYGALLHDIGKVGMPISILEKAGKLTKDEWVIMRAHMTLGEHILGGCVDEEIEHIAMRHHEKLNGKGYPYGLCAEQITMPQRLLAVADVTSALCMGRSYKEAFSKNQCLSILKDMVCEGELDGDMVSLVEEHFDDIVFAMEEALVSATKKFDSLQKQYLCLEEYFSKKPNGE